MRKEKKESHGTGRKMYTTILLALVALVGMTALTVAWFSIADRTNLYSLELSIVSGPSLRIDLDAHETFDNYVQTLSFEQIAERVRTTRGYDMKTSLLKPVTTTDSKNFTFRSGTSAKSDDGTYWEFPLHFMATEDCIVHLSGVNSPGKDDATLISAANPDFPKSMRVSFESDGKIWVYDPGDQNFLSNNDNFQKIYLHFDSNQVYNQNSSLFSLQANTDKEAILRVWMEGTDEACTDALKGIDFSIRLRFEATDENGNTIVSKNKN